MIRLESTVAKIFQESTNLWQPKEMWLFLMQPFQVLWVWNLNLYCAYQQFSQPGYVSLRHCQDGSWFIQILCQVFEDYAGKAHLEDLLKYTSKELGLLNSAKYGYI